MFYVRFSPVLAALSQKKVQEQLLVYNSLRVKVFNEILNGIKVYNSVRVSATFIRIFADR